MPVVFPFSRDPHTPRQGLHSFFVRHGIENGDRPLCEPIERITGSRAVFGDRNLTLDGMVPPWRYFPWIMPILGTGCTTPERELASTLTLQIDDAVEKLKPAGPPSDENAAWQRYLEGNFKKFVKGLIGERLHSTGAKSGDEDHVENLNEGVLDLLVLASLLTYLFHVTASVELPVPDGEFVAAMPIPEVQTAGALSTSQAKQRCGHYLEKVIDRYGDQETIRARLKAVENATFARIPTIDVKMVAFVTELAWVQVMRENGIFPGWDEMLFRLSLHDLAEPPSFNHRPNVRELEGLAARLREDLTEPAASLWASWLESSRGGGRSPSALHAGVAEMLWAQCDAKEKLPTSGALPPTSAVVTSLDLTLEFALITDPRAEGRSFCIILPVLNIEQSGELANPLWIRGRVTIPERSHLPSNYDDFFREIEWEPLTDASPVDSTPHVIHLAGCPLVTLPATIATVEPEMRIFHAVILDEHASMQFASAELFSSIVAPILTFRDPNWTIPRFLRLSADDERRFWLGLGVQMHDPAIRHRLASFLLDRTSWGDGQRRGTSFHGMVVDLSITGDNSSLFQWLGFDLVVDSPDAIVDHLAHYCEHLRSNGTADWPGRGIECKMAFR